jgi:ribosome biogenesis GTPase
MQTPTQEDDPLEALGWDASFDADLRAHHAASTHVPGRVVRQEALYVVDVGGSTLSATLSGRFKHEAASSSDLPIVGDWVLIRPLADQAQTQIEHLLPRKTLLVRRRVGGKNDAQLLAANVDVALVVLGLDHALNLGLVERAVAMTRAAGIEPIVVLNKADLCADPAVAVAEVHARLPDVAVLTLSAATGQGADAIPATIGWRRTAVMMGPSGVGKSSLVNALTGMTSARTGGIRADDYKGRHTTTHRQLFQLPGGALLIDGPGIRELGLFGASETLDEAFADVRESASHCYHRGCRHKGEPNCAVRADIAAGRLPARRLAEFERLRTEMDEGSARPTPRRRR